MHKKGITEEVAKKRSRKAVKVQVSVEQSVCILRRGPSEQSGMWEMEARDAAQGGGWRTMFAYVHGKPEERSGPRTVVGERRISLWTDGE
jgi:hypothetical protein